MPFDVFIDDNFHYMDESERVRVGTFETYEEAVTKARQIVEESVRSLYKPGMTFEELWGQYKSFGDDPFISSGGFSAWSHAADVAHALIALSASTDSA